MERIKEIIKKYIFASICWLIAGYFLFLAVCSIGYPPAEEIGSTSLTLLIFGLFLFLLPKASKISIGKLLTFEKEVEHIKSEVHDFKSETRELMAVYGNVVTAISSTVNNSVTVNFPSAEERRKAKEDLNASISNASTTRNISEKVDNYILAAGGDINFALAKLRMDLERELRHVLGKKTELTDLGQAKSYLTARQLFRQLIDKYPQYEQMHSSYDYILKACNAAIHGQKIPDGYGEEALYMGLKMLSEFRGLDHGHHQ
jgi:hypothetical protein